MASRKKILYSSNELFLGNIDNDPNNFTLTVNGKISIDDLVVDELTVTSTEFTNANIGTLTVGNINRDPVINLIGDVSGSAKMTNLSSVDITVSIKDDSHNHVISNIDNLQNVLNSKQNLSEKGQPNGYASLDSSGTVPSSQLPSYVDDVLEYTDLSSFPVTGETGKIYIAIDSGLVYRWTGSQYIQVNSSVSTSDEATKLSTARNINGTPFDGTSNITTNSWGTPRNITIGSTTKSVNGSLDYNWTIAEMGVAPAVHSHNDLYYTESEISNFFSGTTTITGYNKSNWDTAYDGKINGASFGTSTGVLTLTRQGAENITVNLDGRYLTSSFAETDPTVPAHVKSITTTEKSNWNTAYGDKINSASFGTSTGVLTLTRQDAGTVTVNLDGRYLTSYTETDPTVPSHVKSITTTEKSNWNIAYGDKINSASFGTSTGVLTLTRQDLGTVTVNLDGRYALSSHTHSYLPLTGGTLTGSLTVQSTVTATSYNTSSSLKYKDLTNLDLNDVLDKIQSINVISYIDKSDITRKERIGVTAESLSTVFPQFVDFKNGEPDSVNYGQMTALLICAIQKLNEPWYKKVYRKIRSILCR